MRNWLKVAPLGIIVGLLVSVWVALAACGPVATPMPASTPIPVTMEAPTEKPTSAPTPEEPAVREALEDLVMDPMVRIAERVPGFGGVYLDPDTNTVYIYLQDPSMQELAESVLTEEFGDDLLAGREVQVLEGEYSMSHLNAWYQDLGEVIWQVPGIARTDLDEKTNRIEIGMYPRRGGREEMEAAISTVSVPREAIVIEVGCGGSESSSYLEERAGEEFLRAIAYSLEAMSEASYGETVRLKLTLRNVSDEPVSLYLGGRPPYDFVVTTPNGEQVWHWKCAKISLQPLDGAVLEPGEALEFTGEWEQVDNRGEPVPPGAYLVHGLLDLEHPEQLVTPAHELKIVK